MSDTEIQDNLPALLVVEDEKNTREGLRRALEDRFEVYTAPDVASALNILESEPIEMLLTDLRLGGEADGMDLLDKAQTLPRPPVCVMMTAYGSVDAAVQAMRRGAYTFVTKPLNLEELELQLVKALRSRRVEAENTQLRGELDKKYGLERLVGTTPAMERVFDRIRQVANTTATVLIEGESGTGKELAAQALHNLSSRKSRPFVVVHCAALSPQLLESELFGHEKGAFTGAMTRRVGRFEEANHGTIFLDEIGEIDQQTQVKLLRVLGERTIQRVGGNQTVPVDVRVVAATNKHLESLVAEGKFRDDLFFRLNVVRVDMPPLRDRREDIPSLIAAFIKEFSRENHKRILGVTDEAREALLRHSWPGNVRELRTAIEHGVVLAKGERIGLRDLPDQVSGASQSSAFPGRGAPAVSPGLAAPEGDFNLERMERRMISHVLKLCGGSRTEAARQLGISRRTLHRKINEYQLED